MTQSRRQTLSIGFALAIGLAGSSASFAQTPAAAPPARIRGTIASVDAGSMMIATRQGPTVKVTMPEGFQPTALKSVPLDSIGPNSYVATVATPAADGTLQSSYVYVFTEAQRGVGEGHYDWDLGPGTSMTNATVTSTVQGNSGRTLKMVYKGTPIDIVGPPKTPILMGIPATRDDLKPGAKVFMTAMQTASGSYIAVRTVVTKDGIDPPQ